eukprot:364133-Chlamydomonas_euryale.AAC.10
MALPVLEIRSIEAAGAGGGAPSPTSVSREPGTQSNPLVAERPPRKLAHSAGFPGRLERLANDSVIGRLSLATARRTQSCRYATMNFTSVISPLGTTGAKNGASRAFRAFGLRAFGCYTS